MSEKLSIEVVLPLETIETIVEQVTQRVLVELQRDRARRWLPVREAAVELGMSEGALRKHISRGAVETSRVGSRIVVDMSAIEAS